MTDVRGQMSEFSAAAGLKSGQYEHEDEDDDEGSSSDLCHLTSVLSSCAVRFDTGKKVFIFTST
jgi:hypothetical protein